MLLLDAEAESRLMDALGALREKAPMIVVSHRQETLQRCDRVIVLQEGRVVEAASSAATIART